MATHTAALAQHATLSASTVDTITLTAGFAAVEVINRGATDPIYARFDGVAPVAEADENIVIPPGSVYTWPCRCQVVKLISAGAMAYSVQGVP